MKVASHFLGYQRFGQGMYHIDSEASYSVFTICVFKSNAQAFVQKLHFLIFFLVFLLQIYGWNPEPYKIDELPDDMPESLKTYINETEDLKQEQKEGMVWFSCEGENPADKEHIGHIDYLPKPGVPKFHYPYTNQDGYHSPAVFAHFTNPKRKSVELKTTTVRPRDTRPQATPTLTMHVVE